MASQDCRRFLGCEYDTAPPAQAMGTLDGIAEIMPPWNLFGGWSGICEMGCFLAYEPEILGIFGEVGVRNAHLANASR